MKKEFSLAVVLSVVLDKILVTKISEIREFCSFMVGQEVYSHQITRAVEEIKFEVSKQIPPGLASLNSDDINENNALQWLESQKIKFGETISLAPITGKKFDFSDPLGDMPKTIPVIVVS
jgi:hypothetical protein